MTIKEVKDVFNIDITAKNRAELHVYLKTLYVEKNKSKKNNSKKNNLKKNSPK